MIISNEPTVEIAGPPDCHRTPGAPDRVEPEIAFPGFTALYETTVERMYAYLRTRAGNDEEAADLTQHIYLQALKAWPRRPGTAEAMVPWLFRIGRNAAVDRYRRRRSTLAWENLPESLHPVADQGVEDQVIRRESFKHLSELLDRLPPTKRELLALRFAARLSYAEIGGIIGKSEAAAKQRILRLLCTLKDQHDEREIHQRQ